MNKLLLATRNPGKVQEIKAILQSLPVQMTSLLDFPQLPDVIEDGQTLEENALKKAKEIYRSTVIPTLSDDSGLEVFSLDMRPGVHSARYAGENVSYEANNKKLLAEMQGYPAVQRKARFRCVVAFAAENVGKTTEGFCLGRIIGEPRGKGGFGYDPVFVPNGYQETFAELTPEVKNRISHRAMALRSIKEILLNFYREFQPDR